jgi:hypothetical protein
MDTASRCKFCFADVAARNLQNVLICLDETLQDGDGRPVLRLWLVSTAFLSQARTINKAFLLCVRIESDIFR